MSPAIVGMLIDGQWPSESLQPVAPSIPPTFDPARPGLRVRLQPIDGLTKKGLFDSYADGFLFQVPPIEEFAREYAYTFSDYQTVTGRTLSRPVAPELITVSFPTLFIDDTPEWSLIHDYMPNPIDLAHDLIALCRSGTPCKLTAGQPKLWGGSEPEFSMRCTLRSLKVAERPGEIDARYIDVVFTQWDSADPLSTKKLGSAATSNKLPARVTVRADNSATITPQQAHPAWGHLNPVTLRELSKHFYGSQTRYDLIRKKNGLMKIPPGEPLYPQLAKAKHTGPLIIPKPPEG